MADPTLYQVFLDRVVRHKFAMQGIEIEEGWLDEHDMLCWDALPRHLSGVSDRMKENALPLVDSLMGAVMSRLR